MFVKLKLKVDAPHPKKGRSFTKDKASLKITNLLSWGFIVEDERLVIVLIIGRLKLIPNKLYWVKLKSFTNIKKEIWKDIKIIEYLKFIKKIKLIIKLKYAFLEVVSKIKYEKIKININKIDLFSLSLSVLIKAIQKGSVTPNQRPV